MSYKKLELDGKTAVVIAGTIGIGRAPSQGLAEAGADVIPSSRRSEQVEAAAAEIEKLGRNSLRVKSDVTDRNSLQNLLERSVEKFGKVDILVNCAGRTKRAPTIDFSEDDWNAIIETNLTGLSELVRSSGDICSNADMEKLLTSRRCHLLFRFFKLPHILQARRQSHL